MRQPLSLLATLGVALLSTSCAIYIGSGGNGGSGGVGASGGFGGEGGVGGGGGGPGGSAGEGGSAGSAGQGGAAGGGGLGGFGGSCGAACACDFAIDLAVPSTVAGSNAGAAADLSGGPTCAVPVGGGGETVYQVTVPAGASQLLFQVTSSAGSNHVLYVRGDCTDPQTELACVDASGAGGVEKLGVGDLVEGQVLYLAVDSGGAQEGDFTLDVSAPAPESDCNDLIDNDFDGVADCQDEDCAATPACAGGMIAYGGPCTQQNECQAQNADPVCLDEAFFGFPHGYCAELCDVAVGDCAGDGRCLDVGLGLGAGACFDGCAADGDCQPHQSCIAPTQVDPAQPAGSSICYPFEKSCGDGLDNDDDGSADCADWDCLQSPACAGDLCATATAAVVGANQGNNLGSTNALAGACGGAAAFEQLFVYTPPADQSVTFSVTAASDLLVYVFTDCADPIATGLGCSDAAPGGALESLTVSLTGGVDYYVAVDSHDGTSSGPFSLGVTVN